jgi:ABC-2 type transport system ATP-binding protein
MEVSLEKITKQFNGIPVVFELDMAIKGGQIVGLLGPNGAGKTTTLRMILNIIRPDEGEIRFDGKRLNKHIRNRIGYLPEERGVYQRYKVSEVLIYFGRLKNLSKRKSHVESVRFLDRFNMINFLDERVSNLSKGMQQKLQFIISIMHDPDILIFDEPFWGLDPFNQQMIKDYIFSLKEKERTILLSTHQLEEAENLCDRFVLIDHGRIVLDGTLDNIRKGFRENIVVVESKSDLKLLQNIKDINRMTIKNSKAFIELYEDKDINGVLSQIINTVDVVRIDVNKPCLRDIFLKTIQEK